MTQQHLLAPISSTSRAVRVYSKYMCTALVGEEDELSELHRKIKSQTKEETKPKLGG